MNSNRLLKKGYTLMKRICVVVNSRANYARIKSVLTEIKKP